ncbi:MAG: hypothetical protein K8S99_16880 [Planctomycetes bacterium]|nr:hypothetical protein [Planctomycetota bacterium]
MRPIPRTAQKVLIAALSLVVLGKQENALLGDEVTEPATESTPSQLSLEEPRAADPVEDDNLGLFPWTPFSLVGPHIKNAEKAVSDATRIDLGFRAAFFFQQATGGPGERTAAAQDYRVYGTFHAINWEPDKKGSAGNIYFRAEDRREMGTTIEPKG